LAAGMNILIYDGDLERPETNLNGWILKDGKNEKESLEVFMWPEISLGISLKL
jgi:hypothetical protein